MSNGNYSWQEVQLGMDVRSEALEEEEKMESILADAKAEKTAQSAWSLGLSLLGGAVFGPAGYFVGKQLGTYIPDTLNKWEGEEVDPGKFNKKLAQDFNKQLKKDAKSIDQAQWLNSALDLASMYVQAGGLEKGPTDFTTFGSGGVEGGEWSVLGKGPKHTFEGAGTVDFKAIQNPDYVPSLFSGWQKGEGLLANLKPIQEKLRSAYTADKSITSLDDLGRLFSSYGKNVEEEKPKGSTFGTLQDRYLS